MLVPLPHYPRNEFAADSLRNDCPARLYGQLDGIDGRIKKASEPMVDRRREISFIACPRLYEQGASETCIGDYLRRFYQRANAGLHDVLDKLTHSQLKVLASYDIGSWSTILVLQVRRRRGREWVCGWMQRPRCSKRLCLEVSRRCMCLALPPEMQNHSR